MKTTIINILIKRDNMTRFEATELISQAQQAFNEYMNDGDLDSAYNICEEFFGLEPDYMEAFI